MNGEKSIYFIWSIKEALLKQHEQTAKSACGASAIVNVLVNNEKYYVLFLLTLFNHFSKNALDFKFNHDTVCSQVKINIRIPECDASTRTLLDYLKSRSIAGMNGAEMIENVNRITLDKISGRLFPFHSNKTIDLIEWLTYWMKKGNF